MTPPSKSRAELLQANAELTARLEEAEDTLRAIRTGEVDALVMGEEVYTLKGAETPYRVLIEQMYEGAGTLLDDGTVLYANRRLGELLRTPLQELIGRSLRRFVDPSELAVFDTKLAEGKQRSSKGEFTLLRQDGTALPVQLSFSVVVEQDTRPICVIVIDLAERKRAEQALQQAHDTLEQHVAERTGQLLQANQALRQSEALLRSITDNSPDPIFLKDRAGRLLLANPATLRALQRSAEEVLGKTDADFCDDPAIGRLVMANDRRLMESGQGEVTEEIVPSPGGPRTFLSVRTPYRDAEGRVIGIIGVAHDITGRKRAEAEKQKLEAQNLQLQKSESLGRMAGAIAHHFNNQLQAVIMSLELAREDLPQIAEAGQCLTEALQSARQAAEVSSLMLTYLGQTVIRREPLDLSGACRRSLSLVQAIMPSSIVLELTLPSSGPTINADAGQLQQVLTNLAANAWEATSGEHGTLHLTVKTVSGMDIPAVHRFPVDFQPRDQAYACLEMADTGSGMPDKDIDNIFDPFFSSKFTGRGMGLAVVLGIVRRHDGAITVESQPGQGSIFRVFLPVSAEAVPHVPVSASQPLEKVAGSPPARRTQEGTVLVVEDDAAVRATVIAALRRLGFDVLPAVDGVEAVDLFRQHRDKIVCVLCDLTMPRLGGWETLTALRKLAPDIPVILASGYTKTQVMEGQHQELPQAFLTKPYGLQELGSEIVRVMRSPNHRRPDPAPQAESASQAT